VIIIDSIVMKDLEFLWHNRLCLTYLLNVPGTKDEKGDLVADSHKIVARWRNCFSQLLNVHGDNDVRKAEIQTAEPLVPEPSAFEVEMAIEKLKRNKPQY
jgi:hypothetical protein